MNQVRTPLVLAAVVAAVVLALASGLRTGSSVAATTAPGRPAAGTGSIVATYGVGGVLKADGVLYQWRPESKKWVTIDESFRLDGEKRSILPLPVQATDVSRMEGFGFIVTRSGTCWLYSLDTNKWQNIGRP